jgi:hypothetical protein
MTSKSEETKPYVINFEGRNGYLYAYAQAEKDSYEISLDFWTQIAQRCKENGFSKVLVEEDFGTDNSTIDMYELVSQGHQIGLTGLKIAFVDRHITQIDNNLFGETVARNRGLLAKVFTDTKEAEAWLLL